MAMKNTQLQDIGNRICNCRKSMGYTQEKLAESMNVSIQMISNIERGNKAIRIENLIKLCGILNVSTDYILKGEKTTAENNTLTKKISCLTEDNRMIVELLVDTFLKLQNKKNKALG